MEYDSGGTAGRAGVLINEGSNFDAELENIEAKRQAALALAQPQNFVVAQSHVPPTAKLSDIGWADAAPSSLSSHFPSFLPGQALRCLVGQRLSYAVVSRADANGKHGVLFSTQTGEGGAASTLVQNASPGLSFDCDYTVDLGATFGHADTGGAALRLRQGWQMVASRFARSKEYMLHENAVATRRVCWEAEQPSGIHWITTFADGHLECEMEGRLSVEQQVKAELLIKESRGGKMDFNIGGFTVAAVTMFVSGGEEETLGMGILKVAFVPSTVMRPAEWDELEQQWKPPPQGAASMAVVTSYDESVDFSMEEQATGDLVGKLPAWSCVNARQVDDFILGSRVFQRLQTSGAGINVDSEGNVVVSNCSDLEGVQREFRKFLRSNRQDLQVVLDAVVIPQAKRSVVLLPVFTYSRGEQISVIGTDSGDANDGAAPLCTTVEGLTPGGLYLCRIHNCAETIIVDLHEGNHRPIPVFCYAKGIALSLYHDNQWRPVQVQYLHGSSSVVSIEMQDGRTVEAAADLNPSNHCVMLTNTAQYEAARSAYLSDIREKRFGLNGTVMDMAAGAYIPLRKVENSITLARPSTSPFCRTSVQVSSAPSLATEMLKQKSGKDMERPLQAILRGAVGSGRTWALDQWLLTIADADGGDCKLVPLLIDAKDLAMSVRAYRRNTVPKNIPAHLISWYIQEAYGEHEEMHKMLLQALHSGRLILAIDGIDEVPDIQEELEICLVKEIAPLGLNFVVTCDLDTMSPGFETSGNCVLLDMQPTTLEQRLAVIEMIKPRFAEYFKHATNFFSGVLESDNVYGQTYPERQVEEIPSSGEWSDVARRPLQEGNWVPGNPTENLKTLYERAQEAKEVFDAELSEIIADEGSKLSSDNFDVDFEVCAGGSVQSGILDWKASMDGRIVVREVKQDSVAWKAGVRVGMVLDAANDEPVENLRELKQLLQNLTAPNVTLTFSGKVLYICELKDRKRARAKSRGKYLASHYISDGVAAILDVVRATIMCEHMEQVLAVVDLIHVSHAWEVLRLRNRFVELDATHNRRIIMNVAVQLGDTTHIAEIVIQLAPLVLHREAHPEMYVAPCRFFGRLLKEDTGSSLVTNESWDVLVRRMRILRMVMDSADYTALLLNALQGAADISKLPPLPGTPAKLYYHALRGSIRRIFASGLEGSESEARLAQMRQRGLLDLLASIAFRAHERKKFVFDFDDVLEAAGEDNDIRDLWIQLSAERRLPFVLIAADDDYESRKQPNKIDQNTAKDEAASAADSGAKKKKQKDVAVTGPKGSKRSKADAKNSQEEEAAKAAAEGAEAERLSKLSGVKSRYKFVTLGIQEYLAATGLLQELNRNPSGVQLWKIYGDNTDVLEDPFFAPMFDMLGEVQGASKLLFKARMFRSLHCTEQTVGGLAQMHRWYPHLDKIDLSQNSHISSMETFSAFKTIQSLRLVECSALRGSLEHLSSWSALRVLTLAGTSLESNLKFLEKCVALEDISFAGCNHISGTLDSFHAMKNLKYVDLAATDLTGTLDALANCTKLRALSLFQCDGVGGSLEPLASCPMLQNLTLTLTQIYGPLAPLAECPLLQELRLSGTNVSGPLDALANCKKLQMLSLYKTQVEGVLDPLSGCSEIMSIDVSGGMVYKYQPPREYKMKMEGNVTSLVKCRKLAFLRVEYTFVTGNVSTLNAERARLDDKAEAEAEAEAGRS
jgi:hypothetical protein